MEDASNSRCKQVGSRFMSLEEKVQQFPPSPGVYLMRDGAGEII